MTDFPSNDYPLPIELCYDLLDDPQLSLSSQSNENPGSILKPGSLDHFGRQAQAIAMLDQILRQLNIAAVKIATRPGLGGFDSQLQAFSALIMSEYRAPGRHCTANAIVIR
jgi:hypothetical protein